VSVLRTAFETFRVRWEERSPDDRSKIRQHGVRRGQMAAVYAGAGHVLGSPEIGRIVMPTGTGKSAVMILIAALVEARRVLVIASSQTLRWQLSTAFQELDPFVKLKLIRRPDKFPVSKTVEQQLTTERDWLSYMDADVIVALPQSISPAYAGIAPAPKGLFDLVLIDEGHHAAAHTWKALLDQFADTPRLMFTATPYRLDGRPLPGEPVFTYSAKQAYDEGIFGQVHYEAVAADTKRSPDIAVRDAVLLQLNKDRAARFNHRVLVKCKTIKRAKEVADLYRAAGCAITAVHSDQSEGVNKQLITDMRAGKLLGLACANMLGEGFDEPMLKIAGLHDQDKSLPVTLQFIGRFARTNRDDIGPAHFFSMPSVTQSDKMLRQLYAREAIWATLVTGFADRQAKENADRHAVRKALWDAPLNAPSALGDRYWEFLRPRQKVRVFHIGRSTLHLERLAKGLKEGNVLYRQEAPLDIGSISLCVEGDSREPGWSEGGGLMVQAATLYIAFVHTKTRLLFFHCSGDGPESSQKCLEAIGAGRLSHVDFEDLNRIFDGSTSLYPFNVGLRTRAHVFGVETYRSSLGKAAGDTFTASDGLRYHRGHCAARVDDGAILGMSDNSKIWGGKNQPIDEFVEWCSDLAERISGNATVDGRRGYFSLPVRKPIKEIARGVAGADWPPIAYRRNLKLVQPTLTPEEDQLGQVTLLRDVEIKIPSEEFKDAPQQQMTLTLAAPSLTTRVIYRPAANKPFSASEAVKTATPADELYVRFGKDEDSNLIDFLNEYPPSLFTLYGAAMVGGEGLPELSALNVRIDRDFFEHWTWKNVRIRSERRADDGLTVQDRAIVHLLKTDPDVLFFDDGSGELADLVTVKLTNTRDRGEIVTLGLFHCKASLKEQAGARVDDYYEVAGQAIKSAQKLVFSEIRDHLHRRVHDRGIGNFLKGNINVIDTLLSGNIQRLYTYEIAVVQPGLSVKAILAQRDKRLANLISLTREMIDVPGFARFRFIGSP